MVATHKLSGSNIRIRTSLSQADLMALCERVGRATEGVGARRGTKDRVQVFSKTASQINFSVKGGRDKTVLTFHVLTAPDDGGATLVSAIDQFATVQSSFFGAPAGKKEMRGYDFYREFMLNLQSAVKGRDQSARCVLSE